MSEFAPIEKGVPIRQPSTANFVIDSTDRYSYAPNNTAGSFTIQKTTSLLNGFFTRAAVTEVVLDWGLPNVYDLSGTYYYPASVYVDISGTSYQSSVSAGLYNVAQALDALVVSLNAIGSGAVFSIVQTANTVALHSTKAYRFPAATNKTLIPQLGFITGSAYVTDKYLYTTQWIGPIVPPFAGLPDLRRIKYIDIVSNQLTYNQAVRDGSTALQYTDILARYYITSDSVPSTVDKYGFVIYPEYSHFLQRIAFPFPKQIRWLPNMPIGQLSFEVFATYYANSPQFTGTKPLKTEGYEWMMTLQVSEV